MPIMDVTMAGGHAQSISVYIHIYKNAEIRTSTHKHIHVDETFLPHLRLFVLRSSRNERNTKKNSTKAFTCLQIYERIFHSSLHSFVFSKLFLNSVEEYN